MKLRKIFEYYEQLLLEGKVELIVKKQKDAILKSYKRQERQRSKDIVEREANVLMSKNKDMDIDTAIATELVKLFQGTHNKYTQWLTNRYVNNEFMVEDLAGIRDDLKLFDKVKSKLVPIKRDINHYKTLGELYDQLDHIRELDIRSQKEKDKERKEELFKSGDAKEFYKDSKLRIVIPRTEEAACILGRGTRWCTSATNNNQFDNYNKHGSLYIIYAGKKMYQIHFEAKQFMDERDVMVDEFEFMINHPSIVKAFGNKWWEYILANPNHKTANDVFVKLAWLKKNWTKDKKKERFENRRKNASDGYMTRRALIALNRIKENKAYHPFEKKKMDYLKKHYKTAMKELASYKKSGNYKDLSFDALPVFKIISDVATIHSTNSLYKDDATAMMNMFLRSTYSTDERKALDKLYPEFMEQVTHFLKTTDKIFTIPDNVPFGKEPVEYFLEDNDFSVTYFEKLIDSILYLHNYKLNINEMVKKLSDKIYKEFDMSEDEWIQEILDFERYGNTGTGNKELVKLMNDFYKKHTKDMKIFLNFTVKTKILKIFGILDV